MYTSYYAWLEKYSLWPRKLLCPNNLWLALSSWIKVHLERINNFLRPLPSGWSGFETIANLIGHVKTQTHIRFNLRLWSNLKIFASTEFLFHFIDISLNHFNHFPLACYYVASLEYWIALEHVHFFVHGCHWLMQQWWFHDMSEIRQEGAAI